MARLCEEGRYRCCDFKTLKEAQINKYRAKVAPASSQRNPVYAGMLKTLDEVVGRIVAALEKANVLDNTLIIFTSDNGPYFIANQQHMPAEFHKVPVTSAAPRRSEKEKGRSVKGARVCRWLSVGQER